MSKLQVVLADEDVVNYVDGIGLHWYYNIIVPTEFLKFASNNVANSTKVLFKLATEASNGFLYGLTDDSYIELGSWTRGDRYLKDILVVSLISKELFNCFKKYFLGFVL